MSNFSPNYYETLQVEPTASSETIESVYRRLAKIYHPDYNIDADTLEQMQAINAAYAILGDPQKRHEYDLDLVGRTGILYWKLSRAKWSTPLIAVSVILSIISLMGIMQNLDKQNEIASIQAAMESTVLAIQSEKDREAAAIAVADKRRLDNQLKEAAAQLQDEPLTDDQIAMLPTELFLTHNRLSGPTPTSASGAKPTDVQRSAAGQKRSKPQEHVAIEYVAKQLQPSPGVEAGGIQAFEWIIVGDLPADNFVELVFWKDGEDPLRDGFGIAPPTRATSIGVDLDELDTTMGGRLEPGDYQWGLIQVQIQPDYRRLELLSEGQPIRFNNYGTGHIVRYGADLTEPGE